MQDKSHKTLTTFVNPVSASELVGINRKTFGRAVKILGINPIVFESEMSPKHFFLRKDIMARMADFEQFRKRRKKKNRAKTYD